jgi:hypothetical protein
MKHEEGLEGRETEFAGSGDIPPLAHKTEMDRDGHVLALMWRDIHRCSSSTPLVWEWVCSVPDASDEMAACCLRECETTGGERRGVWGKETVFRDAHTQGSMVCPILLLSWCSFVVWG